MNNGYDESVLIKPQLLSTTTLAGHPCVQQLQIDEDNNNLPRIIEKDQSSTENAQLLSEFCAIIQNEHKLDEVNTSLDDTEPECNTEAESNTEPECITEPECLMEPECVTEPECLTEPECNTEPECSAELDCNTTVCENGKGDLSPCKETDKGRKHKRTGEKHKRKTSHSQSSVNDEEYCKSPKKEKRTSPPLEYNVDFMSDLCKFFVIRIFFVFYSFTVL